MAKKENGGIMSRIGKRFYKEVERIKDARLRNGKSKDRIATEKITNLIIRHKVWKEVADAMIEIDEEEVNKFGHE